MNYQKLLTIFKKDASYFLLANILFSISSMLVNFCLPKILELSFFNEFIYIFQMVLFLTNISQVGIILGLYKYIHQSRNQALNIYFTSISVINIIILSFGMWADNPLTQALKLTSLTRAEQMIFYGSVMISGIFLYNKGRNVAEKAYKYMIRISATAFILRMLAIGIIYYFGITDISSCLLLIFVLPFSQDIWDYITSSYRFICPKDISKKMLQNFWTYSIKIWLVASLFNIADRIFIISTKGLSTSFTTSLAFSTGFVGIISLFNNSFYNYFLAKLDESNLNEIKHHITRLHRLIPLYTTTLFLVCACTSIGIKCIFSELGEGTPMICFIILLRTGLISYIGMYSLLSKILNMLNLEILLNILRVLLVWCLCNLWHPSSMFLWYIVVTFSIPLPELVMSIIVIKSVNNRVQTQISK